MYEKYYSAKKNIVCAGLGKMKAQGKTLAVWSAGNRGRVFLKICDPEREYIDYVFDMNDKLFGQCMDTGHYIVDYRSTEADVIILVDPIYSIDSIIRLKSIGNKAKICCLEDIIYGNRSLTEALDLYVGRIELKKIHRAQIASLTIVYNTDIEEVMRNVMTYADKVERVYIFDNSSESNQDIFDKIEKSSHIHYIHGNGVNYGIGSPINQVAREIIKEGFDWLITFDQDSRVFPDTIDAMRNYVESSFFDNNVGVVAPNVFGNIEPLARECREDLPYLTYKNEIIQSGAMHRLDVWRQIGGYNEELFIDFVDFEYCFRVKRAGYSIVHLNRFFIQHQTKDGYEEFFSKGDGLISQGKYSLKRLYYHFRNFYYCWRKYGKFDPVFAEECADYKEMVIRKAKYDFPLETIERILSIAESDAVEQRMGEAKCLESQGLC